MQAVSIPGEGTYSAWLAAPASGGKGAPAILGTARLPVNLHAR